MCHHQQTTPRILPASPQEACASPTLEYKHLAVEAIVPNVLLVLRSGLEGNQVFLVLGKDRLLLRGKLGLDLFEDVFRARVRRVLRDSRVYRIRSSSHTFIARARAFMGETADVQRSRVITHNGSHDCGSAPVNARCRTNSCFSVQWQIWHVEHDTWPCISVNGKGVKHSLGGP